MFLPDEFLNIFFKIRYRRRDAFEAHLRRGVNIKYSIQQFDTKRNKQKQKKNNKKKVIFNNIILYTLYYCITVYFFEICSNKK